MKTLKKSFLPSEIIRNGRIYKRGEQTKNSILVEVLANNLKNRLNIHGNPYQPTKFYFNPIN